MDQVHQVSAWRSTRGHSAGPGHSGDLPAVLKGDIASQGILQGWGKKISSEIERELPKARPGQAGHTHHCSSLA